ncbi:Retrotransposon protein [Seminavis robusta]|uniref:Retrotransposon protein n=1 Tax=Seminavis robusta TaxID=568900 RepID=A0A9N8EZT7_9STRA|nr:Retrotransposon protein [Seminavis robusta]|eukprot:Sro2313_g322880.1 Retrotransposon protein (295) ;mRNA; f:13487-14371
MEEPSKQVPTLGLNQVNSDIIRPRSKPSLFSNLEGTSPMDKVTQGRIPDRFGDPGDPGGSGYHSGDDSYRGFRRKGRHGGPPGGGPPGDPWDPDGGGDPPAGPGGGGGGDGPRRKLFHAKPDSNAYPTLKSNKDFDQWYSMFITTARAQGFHALFDSNYVPLDQESAFELRRMNEWFYAVLQKIIKTTKGKVIVKEHFHDCDCFHILHALIQDAHTSVEGTLESMETLNWLTRVKYSTTKGSAVEFIINYDEVLTRYNDSKTNEQDKLSDSIQKLFLQQAFIDIKVLNDISARE